MGKLTSQINLPNPDELKRVPFLVKLEIAIWLIWAVYMPKLPLPFPVHYAILSTFCMFMVFPIMPHKALAIPIVIGIGLSGGLLLSGGHYVPTTFKKGTNFR